MKLNKKLPNKIDFTIKNPVNQITDNHIDSNDNDIQIENTNYNKRSKKTEEIKEEMATNIENKFKGKRIIFYIIIIIFQLFSWYFISCFCALYKKTQKYLGIDIGKGILLDLISSLFISFYILIIRIIIIKSSFYNFCIKIFNCNKCLKNSKKFIKEKVIIFLFQKTIEFLIAYYIKNKIPFLSDFYLL